MKTIEKYQNPANPIHYKIIHPSKELSLGTFKLLKDNYDKAANFIDNYIKSPGYKQRFKRFQKLILPHYNTYYNTEDSPIKVGDHNYYLTPDLVYKPQDDNKIFAYVYKPHDNNVYLKSTTTPLYKNNPFFDSIFVHELAHILDQSTPVYKLLFGMIPTKTDMDYSLLYPVFRNSSSLYPYKRYETKNPNNSSFPYDGRPNENYARLMALRYDLLKLGIYDSFKADNPFTERHLQQYIENPKKSPQVLDSLYKEFNTEDIILMMNTVAQNEIETENKKLYT